MEFDIPGMDIGGGPRKFGEEAMPGIGIAETPGYWCGNELSGVTAGTGGKLENWANDCVADILELNPVEWLDEQEDEEVAGVELSSSLSDSVPSRGS